MKKRRERDLNPRSCDSRTAVFETAPFDLAPASLRFQISIISTYASLARFF